MQVLVKKWRNSAAVRIPAAVMRAAKLALKQPVDVRAEAGRVVIEPIRKAHFDIERLIAGISRDNCHRPADFGKPVAREVW